MENRTFFFRDNNYTVYEMVNRLPKDVFVQTVNELFRQNINSKQDALNCFLDNIDDEEERIYKLKQVFNSYGNKGDILNMQLYTLKEYQFISLEPEEEKILLSLKGMNLNGMPFIGSFCDSTCILQDIRISENFIDYKFIFEHESIKEIDGQPTKVIENTTLECRHYMKRNLIALLFNNRKKEQDSAVSIIYTIPYYIYLKINPGYKFIYSEPKYDSVYLNPSQLQCLKLLLNGKLKSTELEVNGELGVKIKIDGSSKEFEDKSIFLHETSPKGQCKTVEFFYSDPYGKKQIITVRSLGQVISTNYVEMETFEDIVRLIYKIIEVNDFLIPINIMVDEYCNFIRRGMITRVKKKHKDCIITELKMIIGDIIDNDLSFKPTEVYLTIVLNIFVKIAISTNKLSYKIALDLKRYTNLINFLKLYVLKKYFKEISQEDITNIISSLAKIIESSVGDEDKLISFYKNNF